MPQAQNKCSLPTWLRIAVFPVSGEPVDHWTVPCVKFSLSKDQHCDLQPLASVSSSKEGGYLPVGSEGLKKNKTFIWDPGWCRSHISGSLCPPLISEGGEQEPERQEKTLEATGMVSMCQTSISPSQYSPRDGNYVHPHFTVVQTGAHGSKATFPGCSASGRWSWDWKLSVCVWEGFSANGQSLPRGSLCARGQCLPLPLGHGVGMGVGVGEHPRESHPSSGKHHQFPL